MIVGALP